METVVRVDFVVEDSVAKMLDKNIGFAGCSFTYGDGLEYYDGTNTLSRFSTLVGNHFNVNTINQSFRGGSHTKIISWWEEYLKNNSVDVFVFQLTRWARSDSKILPNVSHIDLMNHRHNAYLKEWLEKNNVTLDEYIEQNKTEDTLSVLKFLESYTHKFPVYILQWPEDTLETVKSCTWSFNNLIRLKYKDETFECIANLQDIPLQKRPEENSRPELTIATDYANFKKPRKDYHPSKTCHRVIADNIIWRLENDNIF